MTKLNPNREESFAPSHVHSCRVVTDAATDPVRGVVCWAPGKSLWMGGMTLAALVLGPLTFSWGAFAVFLASTGVTLCFGHSVGMHRRLIHQSFDCPKWLEYLCVYLGTLVGMAGPFGMVRNHDFRDWAQRQKHCHDYFCHRQGFWRDAWWQMHCNLVLDNPPGFRAEPSLAKDRFYHFVERSWMLQQLPWALLLLGMGGIGWVVWGICARVTVSVTGHWLVGYYAHREGQQNWIVQGAGVQGHNIRIAGLISMGESWHNNHHAYPGSAKLGLHPGEIDLGWWLILGFRKLGWASRIVTPEVMPHRAALRRVPQDSANPCRCRLRQAVLAWR